MVQNYLRKYVFTHFPISVCRTNLSVVNKNIEDNSAQQRESTIKSKNLQANFESEVKNEKKWNWIDDFRNAKSAEILGILNF